MLLMAYGGHVSCEDKSFSFFSFAHVRVFSMEVGGFRDFSFHNWEVCVVVIQSSCNDFYQVRFLSDVPFSTTFELFQIIANDFY